MKLGTRTDHRTFCITEEWTQVRYAKGKLGSRHWTYELALHDGMVLRTRISHPVNKDTYGARIWAHILRDQLDVTSDEFWQCVDHRILPDRGAPAEAPEALPTALVFQLLRAGVTDAEVRRMTTAQALGRLQEIWSGGARQEQGEQ